MTTPQMGSVLRQLRQTVLRQNGAGMTDGQLLRSFLTRRDEVAFEALVQRHGPMVLGVCRRILRNAADAEDAFQATFLVFVRKATSLATREVIGDWLHGVARRTALKARACAALRSVKERRMARHEAIEENFQPEWQALLDQEVDRLPEKYRVPLVLCDLEGRTRKEAALQLGWPEGTVSGRLARARMLLARRLSRRGVALPAGTLTTVLVSEATASMPRALVCSTVKAAATIAAGQGAMGVVSAPVAALTEGVVNAMFVTKLKTITVLLTTILVLTVGVGVWRQAAGAGQDEDRQDERAVLSTRDTRKAKAPKAPEIPAEGRKFQIDLVIVQEKDGQFKELAQPRLVTVEGRTASFLVGSEQAVQGGDVKIEIGTAVHLVVRSAGEGKIKLDMEASYSTPEVFTKGDTPVVVSKIPYLTRVFTRVNAPLKDDVTLRTRSVRVIRRVYLGEFVTAKLRMDDKERTILEVIATVHDASETLGGAPATIAAAEKDLKIAEFYQRTGHPGAAYFYYEIVRRRYPDTIYAERAKERMAELKKQLDKPAKTEKKPLDRVGQIFIIGNVRTRQDVILRQVPFYPGQILNPEMLHVAERNLTRLGIFKGISVRVLDPESESEFKDILIDVKED